MYSEVPWRLIKGLSRKKERERSGLTVAEGPLVVLSALKARVSITAVVLAEDFAGTETGTRIRSMADNGRLQLFVVPSDLYSKMSDTKSPQGAMCLVAAPFHFTDKSPAPLWQEGLYVIGVDVQDPGNVGTLIRSAASAGAAGVLLCGACADPYGPKVIRASAGAIFETTVEQCRDTVKTLSRLSDNGVKVYAAVPRGGNKPWACDFGGASALVFGNEGQGLGQEVLLAAEAKVTIPMPGDTESLNVAMACSMLVYEAVRQRLKATDI